MDDLLGSRIPEGEGLRLTYFDRRPDCTATEPVGGANTCGGGGFYLSRTEPGPTGAPPARRVTGRVNVPSKWPGNILVWVPGLVSSDPRLPDSLVRRFILGPKRPNLDAETIRALVEQGVRYESYQLVPTGAWWTVEIPTGQNIWLLVETSASPIGFRFENLRLSMTDVAVLPELTVPEFADGGPRDWVFYPSE